MAADDSVSGGKSDAARVPGWLSIHPPGARRARTLSAAVEGEELVVQLPVSAIVDAWQFGKPLAVCMCLRQPAAHVKGMPDEELERIAIGEALTETSQKDAADPPE
jgi:hypothetical protein